MQTARSRGSLLERDVYDFFGSRAEATYRLEWELSSREDKLALFQLSKGCFVNPANQRVLSHLMRRGLIELGPHPRIASEAFREFVSAAELPGKFEDWEREASEGIWQSLRLPLFIVVMLLAAWIAYSSGEVFQALAALLASTLGFTANLLRAVGYVRTAAVGTSE